MKRPAFQLYANDWLASASVLQMSLAAEATYLRLLCHQWNQGVLPADPKALVRLTKCTAAEWRKVWGEIAPHFPLVDGGRANPRLAAVAADAEAHSAKKSTAGKKGNETRWGPKDAPDVAPEPPVPPPERSRTGRNSIAQRSQSDRTATPVRLANGSPSSSLPTTPPPPSAAAEGSPPHGSGGGEAGSAVVGAEPWPDRATAEAAAVLVAERGVTAAGLAGVCLGWAETGLDADRGQPVGWPAVAKAVRDYAGTEGKRWHSAAFAGYVRSAVKQLGAGASAPASAPTDGPRARCAALVAGERWAAPTEAWAEALGTDLVSARRVLAAVVPVAEGLPAALLVELLISERDRVAGAAA